MSTSSTRSRTSSGDIGVHAPTDRAFDDAQSGLPAIGVVEEHRVRMASRMASLPRNETTSWTRRPTDARSDTPP